jgi:hypothetical protein
MQIPARTVTRSPSLTVAYRLPADPTSRDFALTGFTMTSELCAAGNVFTTRWTYLDLVSECEWQVVSPP